MNVNTVTVQIAAKEYSLNSTDAPEHVQRTAALIRLGQEEGSFRAGDPGQLAFHVIMAIGGLRSMAPLMDISKPFLRGQLAAIRGILLTERAAAQRSEREEE